MKYFWREKNAIMCIGKFQVFEPTVQELEKELILKFEQKLNRINIIFDKNARKAYYQQDKKPKQDITGLTEKQIQQKLGLRVVVDFFQLIKDLCNFYEIDIKTEKIDYYFSNDEIKTIIKTSNLWLTSGD